MRNGFADAGDGAEEFAFEGGIDELGIDALVGAVVNDDEVRAMVLELIGLCIKAAERRGRPICLCGEAATDPGQLEDLLSAGLRAISVPPPHLATVRQVIGAHGA